jgi:hypothetical protein
MQKTTKHTKVEGLSFSESSILANIKESNCFNFIFMKALSFCRGLVRIVVPITQ